jgi:hypothetical protein
VFFLVRTTLVVAILSFASLARAESIRIGSLRATSSSGTELVSERLLLECSENTPNQLECSLRVQWELRHSSSEARTANILFTWPHDLDAELVLAGTSLDELPRLRPLAIVVPPQTSVILELRATLLLERDFAGALGGGLLTELDPLAARHPILGESWQSASRGFVWIRPDDLRFASVGPTSIEVRVPDGWFGGADLKSSADARVFTYSSSEGSAHRDVTLQLSRGSRHGFIRHGGPFLAFGGTIDEGIRARLGYTVAFGEFVLASLAVDSDFERQVIITPQVEIASWSMVLIPSLSLGLGVPIRVTEHEMYARTVGLRVEASATFLALGFVATLDIWPATESYQITLLGRIGL